MSTKHIQDDELEKILMNYTARYVQLLRIDDDAAYTAAADKLYNTALQALKAREEAIAVRARLAELKSNSKYMVYGREEKRRNELVTQLQDESTGGAG